MTARKHTKQNNCNFLTQRNNVLIIKRITSRLRFAARSLLTPYFMQKSSVLLVLMGLLAACNSTKKSEAQLGNEALPTVNISIERLEQRLFACKTPADIKSLLDSNATLRQVYFPAQAFGSTEALANDLARLTNDKNLREFYEQGQQMYGNLSEIQTALAGALAHVKAYNPKAKVPRIYTMFTGFMGNDLFVSDSLIVIGLEYFMGAKAKYRPQVYDYQLRRYQQPYIVPQIMVLYAAQYNETNYADQTLLAEMLYFGKSFEFAKQMMPTAADSLILPYSTVQLTETAQAQDLVWAHFIDNQLLYKTDHFTKGKYSGESPSTPVIGPRCPGGIGRWLGWRIVRKYLQQNPDVGLKALMQNKNAQQILEQSKYRGQVEE